MKEEYYKMLLNPSTKEVANKAILMELTEITDESNIISFLTDAKENSSTPYVRATVFVHDTTTVNFKYLQRVEERLKKLFGIKFRTVFCNANLTPNESLRLSSISGKSVLSFVDLENFVSTKWSIERKKQAIENLIIETLRFSKDDSLVICANKRLVSTANELLEKYRENTNIILIETVGKDCSDLRLVQSIQKLYDLKRIENYYHINIVSGDGFFDSIIQYLEKKEINLSVFGQEGKTHNKLTNRRNFIMLNDFNLAS